ncbi:phage portal protein [Streptomyces violaceusniger]|uniref:Phage portal protein, HK97 family n=1 Tax=Streptomyces violaceusniger (strain Tu 4113) TaxID=653045 RepID=G2P7C1_STRV4|nr:phage portal protein [Streptomyces violaceusniger]AEM87081.1 phage portal protein, HK97 family [Streptomyces violaceusniger Tu 4113]
MSWWWPFRRREQQRAITYQDVWGSGGDPAVLRGGSQERALRLAPVYAATRLLADSVASLPIRSYAAAGEARRPISTPSLFVRPAAIGTRYDWLHRAMTSLTLRGNAYGLIVAWDRTGWPSQIEWLHPDDVSIEDNFAPHPVWYYKGRRLDEGQMFHVPAYTLPGQTLGLSPIQQFALTTDTGLLAQQFGRDWFANGSTPAAVLETDREVQAEAATILKARFEQAAEGRGVAVLGLGTKYKPISVPAEESQFLETIKASANQIAAIYGVPPEKIGGTTGNSLTYSTVEQNSLDLLTWTLRPWLARLEEALSLLRPPDESVKFNADAMLRTDTLTRYRAHSIARRIGLNSIDELRALEDEQPLPDGQGQDYTPLGGLPPDGSENP